ncbi:MAG TPA: FtsX-like permease family protein [Segeticoccus sp.]|nr:FtsX-like permease family protein [Segeticoccus sp.]
MFLALRDLRFARGRFALLTGVIALMTFMVVMLSGLTAGLRGASVSALDALPVDRIAFQSPATGQQLSFTSSSLPADAASDLAGRSGVDHAFPLGVATDRLDAGDSSAAVALIGTDPALYPTREHGSAISEGEVAVSAELAADADLSPGDRVEVAGTRMTVGAVLAEASFNHLPAVYSHVDTWHRVTHNPRVTAVALRTNGPVVPPPGMQVIDKSDAYAAVGGFSSEQGSLNIMRILLVVVSVLIIGGFFTIWTMQRSGDLAVVRAMGGSARYLLGDALGQALLVLVVGAVVGAAVATGLGVLAARVVPFVLTAGNVALPLAAIVVIGLLGTGLSVRRISNVDPLTALGAAR